MTIYTMHIYVYIYIDRKGEIESWFLNSHEYYSEKCPIDPRIYQVLCIKRKPRPLHLADRFTLPMESNKAPPTTEQLCMKNIHAYVI